MVKKFKFGLDTLLQVRERKEEAARQDLATAHRVLQEKIQVVEALEKEGNEVEESMRYKKGVTLAVVELKERLQYMELVRKRIADGQDAVMKAKNVVALKREVAEAAMRDRKTIENLKEKQYVRWKKEVATSESALLDELATVRHLKGNKT